MRPATSASEKAVTSVASACAGVINGARGHAGRGTEHLLTLEEGMAAPERCEILILGSGAGGKLLAWHMAQSGRRTAVVEHQWIGGSCPNVNCMPSKNEIWSANVAHVARHAAKFGTKAGRVTVDMVAVRQYKRDMVEAQIAAHLRNYKDSGTELILGSGRFVGPKTLEVGLNGGGTRARTLRVHGRSGKDVTVAVRTAAGEQRIEGSDLLVAVGRTPNTSGIGLEEAGVALDTRGYVRVNERLQTSAPDVWAIGECAGSPHFTHASVDDFRIIMDNLAGGKRSTRDRLIPYCVFTDPPLAHVGLHEGDLRRQGVTARVAKLPMNAVLRVQASGEGPGFMKVLVGASDDRIRGFTMIGPEAGEVVSAVQVAMLAGLPYPKLRDAVLAHLTMAEGLGFLLSNGGNAERGPMSRSGT